MPNRISVDDIRALAQTEAQIKALPEAPGNAVEPVPGPLSDALPAADENAKSKCGEPEKVALVSFCNVDAYPIGKDCLAHYARRTLEHAAEMAAGRELRCPDCNGLLWECMKIVEIR